MKNPYDIVWAETAENDLCGIIEYLAKDNPSQAKKIFNKIKRAASGLYHSPKRGRIIPELQEQGLLQYRELIISPWRVMYRISGKTVLVLSVLDSRRNVEDILLGRLIQ
jgi:addiction module RelE/StbE family toxin